MLIFSGKIPVRVNPFFLLLCILIGWLNTSTVIGTLIWMGVIFVSVLVHEYGHALTAVCFGQRAEIELHGLGGITRRHGGQLPLFKEFLIVLNGPLAGFFLFIISYYLGSIVGDQRPQNFIAYALSITMIANFFWTIVNLIPVYPLDGGHLMRILLEGAFGFRGVQVSLFISMALSIIIGAAFIRDSFLLSLLFFLFAFESWRTWQSALVITSYDQNPDIQKRFKDAESTLREGNASAALEMFLRIRDDSGKGRIFTAATELAAKILTEKRRFQDAYELLRPHLKQLSLEGLHLLQKIAYHGGKWSEAISVGNELYRNHPNSETAVLNALCHGTLGQVRPAAGWLRTAANHGLPNLEQILQKREFDKIRNDPDFQQLIHQEK